MPCNKIQIKNLPSEIRHHPIDFIVKSGNENKKNNEKVKNISQNESGSADKEVISSNISLNDQLAVAYNAAIWGTQPNKFPPKNGFKSMKKLLILSLKKKIF